MRLTDSEREEFKKLIAPYIGREEIQRMGSFIQHGSVTTLEHCLRVCTLCFLLNRRMRLHANEAVLITAALMHDMYLYDWHDGAPERRVHGFTHPEAARRNAVRFFDVNKHVQNVISTHMWPLTFRHIPRCREGWILTTADKICSIKETLMMRARPAGPEK